jgi:hypothetical protein
LLLNSPRTAHVPRSISRWSRFFPFFVAVVVIQGIHVIEHIIQLLQVTVFDVPGEKAFGLLGYVINFNDTAEYMHFVFNAAYLLSLYVIVLGVHELVISGAVPRSAFRAFLVFGVGVETWHMAEHVVILYHLIQNTGCPCTGIGDQVIGVMDIQLHFAYNTVAYAGTVTAFWFVHKARARGTPGRRALSCRPDLRGAGQPIG